MSLLVIPKNMKAVKFVYYEILNGISTTLIVPRDRYFIVVILLCKGISRPSSRAKVNLKPSSRTGYMFSDV